MWKLSSSTPIRILDAGQGMSRRKGNAKLFTVSYVLFPETNLFGWKIERITFWMENRENYTPFMHLQWLTGGRFDPLLMTLQTSDLDSFCPC